MLGCVDGYDDGALDGEVEGSSQWNIDSNIFRNKNDIDEDVAVNNVYTGPVSYELRRKRLKCFQCHIVYRSYRQVAK